MSRLTRVVAKIFASNAGSDQRAKFGSLAASAPAFTTDPAEVQSLSQYLSGWFSAVIGGNSPCIEDMNALQFLITYQIASIMQMGVPEYNVETTYYEGQLCSDGAGTIYVSLIDDNLDNALTDSASWRTFLGGKQQLVTASGSVSEDTEMVFCDATAGNITLTMPLLANIPVGREIKIKVINSNSNTVTVQCNTSGNIDGFFTYQTNLVSMDCMTLRKYNNDNWYTV